MTRVVLYVDAQHLLREFMRLRSWTQSALSPILDDRARAITDDGVPASLQRQQECGLAYAGPAGEDYSRRAGVHLCVFVTPNV